MMMSILGIILPLLVTVYASNSEELNLEPGLFTIFFGTLLLVFLEYFGLYICLYLVPKYGLSWNIKELDEDKRRIFSLEGDTEYREETWKNLLLKQRTKYTLHFSISVILDMILFITIGVIAVFLLELLTPIAPGMSLWMVMLVCSVALSACISLLGIWILSENLSRISLKWARKANTSMYLILTAILTAGIWVLWFGGMFI